MRTPLLLVLFAVTGCNDYDLIGQPEVTEPEEPDRLEIDPGPGVIVTPECGDDAPEPFRVNRLEDCRREPEIGTFDPVVEWSWNERRVEAPPLIANLGDDNGDGVVDDLDVPDVVVTSFAGGGYNGYGYLDLIDGVTHTTTWSIDNVLGHPVWALAGLALADLEGDGAMDIVVTVEGGVARVDATGAAVWFTPIPMRGGGGAAISIADMEGDGIAEIVVGGAVIEADGTLRWQHPSHTGLRFSGSFPVDVDGDGLMEVVAGGMLLEHDGTERWRRDALGGWVATIDLELDGIPEFVQVRAGSVLVLDIDGNVVWSATGSGGGAPTVADFDGDGLPEIGYAGREVYRVLDTDGSVLWQQPIRDGSSGFTSSAVFDFEPDGAAEVVYADEYTLWVFDGSSGAVELEHTQHNSGTRYEYPTLADVDQDGSVEIIVPHGRSRDTALDGFSVLGSRTSSWAAARPIWNQHAYHTTHINDDGTVPTEPEANWELYNNFRAGNSEVPLGLETPDLRVGEPVACLEECYRDAIVWHVPVLNEGLQYSGDFHLEVRSVATDEVLISEVIPSIRTGEMRWLGPYRTTREAFGEDGLRIVVDPQADTAHGAVFECDEANNERLWADFPCEG